MAVHVACSWPGSVAHGLLQRVQVSGFRLSRRASATQHKCRKIQAPKGFREIPIGRAAAVHIVLVCTGQTGPPSQKPFVKSQSWRAAWLRPPAPASAQQPPIEQGWAPQGARVSLCSAPGPRQDGRRAVSIGFSGQSCLTIQKSIVTSSILKAPRRAGRAAGRRLIIDHRPLTIDHS